jgi:putative intracellular protease/amidase
MEVAVLLFEDFEGFEDSGIEIFAILKDDYHMEFYSLSGLPVKDQHGVLFDPLPLEKIRKDTDVLLIPGGPGARKHLDNPLLIEKIKSISQSSKYILTIGTGSAFLAKAELLDNMVATTDSQGFFDWIQDISVKIKWNRRALWTVDEKYYTSSTKSGSIDMVKAFLIDVHGAEFLKKLTGDRGPKSEG